MRGEESKMEQATGLLTRRKKKNKKKRGGVDN
jgi:hypothetical protein